MKTPSAILTGLFCAAAVNVSVAADAPAPAPGARTGAEGDDKASKPCRHCGVIEAILPQIVSSGPNGFYSYVLVIRMDETGLRRNIGVNTVGPMNVGDRVNVMGGTVQPLM